MSTWHPPRLPENEHACAAGMAWAKANPTASWGDAEREALRHLVYWAFLDGVKRVREEETAK